MMVYEFAKYPDETVEKGAHLFFKYAREGRIQSAESLIKNQYKIITLCGSIKFKDEFMKVQEKLTLDGNIVLTPNFFNGIKKKKQMKKLRKCQMKCTNKKQICLMRFM